jgi:cytochrome bd-type quinol oxidase subunit 2
LKVFAVSFGMGVVTGIDWFAPFSILTGVGLVLGYALLGAARLVLKSEGELRDWAHMIPYIVMAASAASPEAALQFLFYGGVVVLPVIAVYTIGVYWIFRGKVRKGYG